MADTSDASKSKRQKMIIIVIIGVIAFIVWQAMGLFGGSSDSSAAMTGKNQATAVNNQPPPPPPPPKPAELPKPPALTAREAQLMQLQQETEQKYIAAVNELQMLKVQRDIAETNKAIAAAKLDTVHSEKNIVEALIVAPVSQASYSQTLGGAAPTTPAPLGAQAAAPAEVTQEVTYTAISVSRIQYKWNAVLGNQGNLYSVAVGDVLPPDGSKVVGIDRSGVTLEKDGLRKKISLVPII